MGGRSGKINRVEGERSNPHHPLAGLVSGSKSINLLCLHATSFSISTQ
jgi:hypothetical protein